MKWSLRVAALAVLGLCIASFATIVWAQQHPTPPPPSGPAVVIPSLPASGSPAPVSGVELPKPPEAGGLDLPKPPATPTPAAGGAEEIGPGVSENNLTGRQEPAVSLEWIGPPAAKVGQPADYTIAVRNVCNSAVQQVMVRVRLQQGLQVVATE